MKKLEHDFYFDGFHDDSDAYQTLHYSPSQLIAHRPAGFGQVVIEREADLHGQLMTPAKAREAMQCGKAITGIVVNSHHIVGDCLNTVVLRLLKLTANNNATIIYACKNHYPEAFCRINGGGKVFNRILHSIGLRTRISNAMLWDLLMFVSKAEAKEPVQVVVSN